MEIDQNTIYGANLILRYKITIKNESDYDYVEENESDLGNFQNYGEITNARLKRITCVIQDFLDEKLTYEGDPEINIDNETTIKITRNTETIDGETKQYLLIEGFEDIECQETESVSYEVVSKLNAKDEDSLYENSAKVKSIKTDKMTTLLEFNFEDTESGTQFTITPPTGEDKNKNKSYVGIAIISLAVLASGLLILKKKFIK